MFYYKSLLQMIILKMLNEIFVLPLPYDVVCSCLLFWRWREKNFFAQSIKLWRIKRNGFLTQRTTTVIGPLVYILYIYFRLSWLAVWYFYIGVQKLEKKNEKVTEERKKCKHGLNWGRRIGSIYFDWTVASQNDPNRKRPQSNTAPILG